MDKFFLLQAVLIFVFSISNDWFSILWHRNRDRKDISLERKAIYTAIVAMVLGGIAILSARWIVVENLWLMIPDIIGTGIGSYLGIKHHSKENREPIKVTPAGMALRYYGFYNRK